MVDTIEFVWVVRRRDLFPDLSPQGFLPLAADGLERYLAPIRERGFFVERREAEVCPAWQQVIPYCIVHWEGRLLLIERLAAQSEARLHGLLSIGIGGHINPGDRDPPGGRSSGDFLEAAARRELGEELVLEGELELALLGLLNDDATAVGAVHVGLVFGVRATQEPAIRETDKMRGRLTPLVELQGMCQNLGPFESWTRSLLQASGWEEWF